MSPFFIRRPIVAMVIAIITVLLGVVSLLGLPIAQFPQIIPPQVVLTTSFTGADALTIEQSVATPIEQQMNGVDNMLYIQSTNANDGTMTQNVTFDVGTNIDIDNVLVQNRFSQAQTFLPQDVKNIGVTIKKSLNFPLIVVSIYSPDGRYDAAFLGNYATINVNDALLRIKGVGDIRNLGGGDYSMRVWLKPDVLARLSLTVGDLQNAIRAQNVVNPSGQVGAEPAPAGQQFAYTVRAQGRLVTAEEFGNIIVRENPDGSLIRVSDVGRVELGTQTYTQTGTFNGKPAAVVAAFQTPGSNALDVASQVYATMDELKQRFPPGMEYQVSLDTTATLIPLLTVPVSLIGAFAVFPLLGFSINTLSLFGLVLAIGLVVDDAIVVVEAVERNIEEGLSPRDAALKAMEQVSGPVVAIALVLAAVFVPTAFVPGITGRMYQQFALTIAVSVLISAFNALTLSPALSALLLRPKREMRGPLGWFFRGFNRVFERVMGGYLDGSRALIRKAAFAIILLLVVAVFAGLIGSRLPGGFVPDEDQGYFYVNVQLPLAASLDRTAAVNDKLDAIFKTTPGIKYYTGVAGFSLLSLVTTTYNSFYFITLDDWDARTKKGLTADVIIRELNQRLAGVA